MFEFGKHKGQTFEEVYNTQKGYVKWVLTLEGPTGPMKQFQRYCASQEP